MLATVAPAVKASRASSPRATFGADMTGAAGEKSSFASGGSPSGGCILLDRARRPIHVESRLFYHLAQDDKAIPVRTSDVADECASHREMDLG